MTLGRMSSKIKFLLLFLLAALPLSAQFEAGTGLSAAFNCSGTCSFGNYTVPAAAADQILIVVPTVRYSTSNNLANLTCSVGGVTATFAVRSHSANAATQTALFYILDADLPAAGAQAVVCSDAVVTDLRSGNITVQMLSGRVQAAPEQTNGTFDTSTTLSLDLTSVTDESVKFWAVAHHADPGTETPAGDVDIGPTDSRYHESLAELETTGGSVAIDPSWTNSVISHGVSASFAPQTAATPCTILVDDICTN